MSKIEVNAIEPQCGTTLTVGASGDTITFPAGTTVVNSGTQTGFGRTGTVDWDTTIKTSTITAVSGEGYFVNTSGGAITANLPAGVVGAIVSFKDYAQTFDTNALTISANGSEKIEGQTFDLILSAEGSATTLVYGDATKGWQSVNSNEITNTIKFINASGGTITTSGDYKIHTFTGPGSFCVSCGGNPAGSNTVDYLVVAGGAGGAGTDGNDGGGGGGGAGGYRESPGTTTGSYTVSPLGVAPAVALPVSVTGYPISVGGGGNGGAGTGPNPGRVGSTGSNSVFSTITSNGGGGGGAKSVAAVSGGSGGGASNDGSSGCGGAGNTPPVSPPQGNPGGPVPSGGSPYLAGGGGGATAAGQPGTAQIGAGGAGATSSINNTPTGRAGGGGGSGFTGSAPSSVDGGGAGRSGAGIGNAGTTNSGGGGGAAGGIPGGPICNAQPGGNGGSGIVIIRYKFQ